MRPARSLAPPLSPPLRAQGYGIHHSKVGLEADAAARGDKALELTGDDEGAEADERAPLGGGAR